VRRHQGPKAPSRQLDDRSVAAARVKLARALDLLLRLYPFHGHVISNWRARPDATVGTMGVCWFGGSVQLLWCPDFVNSISEAQLAAVLAHETHHIVMRHPFLFPAPQSRRSRRTRRAGSAATAARPGTRSTLTAEDAFDEYAALVATEVSVNEFVTLPLPGDPLLLSQFPMLPPLESTRQRYARLYSAERAQRMAGGPSLFQSLVGIDNHAGWESFRTGGLAAELAVNVATDKALQAHGDALSEKMRTMIQQAGGGIGSTPGGRLESLSGTAKARLPWQHILRGLLPVHHESEPTFLRPPRRFPELVGVLPGSRRVATKRKILAAIDTSGSMASSTLDEIAAELRVMAKSYDVSIVEFDTVIQRKFRLDGPSPAGGDPLSACQGRGGTSFLPIFAPDTLSWAADGGTLSGIVCFTDGFGVAPPQPPRERVIWILTDPNNAIRRPAPWGTVVLANPSGCLPAMAITS
jgi:hypothetical protein